MKARMFILFLFMFLGSFAQESSSSVDKNQDDKPLTDVPILQNQIAYTRSGKDSNNYLQQDKTELLNSGLFDINNTGTINFTSRFVKFYLGEADRFCIPISIYSGVSSNHFREETAPGSQWNNALFNNLINPVSGVVNLSTDGYLSFSKNNQRLTRIGLVYRLGIRVLTGQRTSQIVAPAAIQPVNFLNFVSVTGLHFQTAVRDNTNSKNVGTMCITGQFLVCKSDFKDLERITTTIPANGIYQGLSLVWTTAISELIDLKLAYSKYIRSAGLESVNPIYNFAFNYLL